MKHASNICILFFIIAGCGGGSSDPPYNDPGYIPNSIYIDPNLGSDTDTSGKIDTPFKTISYSQNYIKNNPSITTIILNPGEYSKLSGEVFPIVIKNNQKLKGIVKNNMHPTINGCDIYNKFNTFTSILLESNSTIEYLSAKCANGISIGVPENSTNVLIKNSIASESKIGIFSQGELEIINLDVSNNSSKGILLATNSIAKISDSLIYKNFVGINIEEGAIVKFENTYKVSGLKFYDNSSCDIWHNSKSVVEMYGTSWDRTDDQVKVSTACTNHVNIAITSGGDVRFGSKEDSNTLSFAGTKRIALVSPINSEYTTSVNPSLYWIPNDSTLSAIGIFSRTPKINQQGIENINDMVWYWHTGLGGGSSGHITFSQGVNGIHDSTPASYLDHGSTYYWAVWEWDKVSGKVISSSNIGIFRTRP